MELPHRTRSRGSRLLMCVPLVLTAFSPVAAQSTSPSQSPGPTADWGPLAVLDDPTASDGLDAGNGPGRVRITDTCVILHHKSGHEDTLAWRSGDSGWDATTHEIVYADDTHGVIRLSDGDRVSLGGFGGFTLAEPPDGPSIKWLIEPDPSCPRSIWSVQEVVLLDDVPPVNLPGTGTIPVKVPNRACVRSQYADPRSHLREDIVLDARQRGWTRQQAEINYCSTEAIGRVAIQVADEDEAIFIGSALSADPVGAPSLYIKGAAPAWVRELIDKESVPIELVDGQPYNFDELDERSTRLAQALLALGYGGVVTHSNITGAGIIPAWVGKTPGLSTDPDEIKALLPADLAPFVVLTVRLSPNERLLPSAAP